MKFKVIEGELTDFEKELNEFCSREDVKVLKVDYSTSMFPQDELNGWDSSVFHNALIEYQIIDKEVF